MPPGNVVIKSHKTGNPTPTVRQYYPGTPYSKDIRPKYVNNLIRATSSGRGSGISHCDICKYSRLSPIEERKVWKCTNCGRETPFEVPTRKAMGNRLVTADKPDSASGKNRTFIMQTKNMRRDFRSIDEARRKKEAHSLDDELMAAGYTVVSSKEISVR